MLRLLHKLYGGIHKDTGQKLTKYLSDTFNWHKKTTLSSAGHAIY